MPHDSELQSWLATGRAAGCSPAKLLGQFLGALQAAEPLAVDTGLTRIDLDRAARCGHPEVIYAPGKPADELVRIVDRLRAAGQDLLATRATPEQAAAVLAKHPQTHWNPVGRTLRLMDAAVADAGAADGGQVAVLTAGTSDRPVAEEALETLRWMRVSCMLIADVGVAGPWRLLEQLPRLTEATAVIVVAGMEGALPSVVGGWVACPVIAVPTSVGYGAAFSGLTALLGMLNSCAANVTVVNIDAGFKAGYLAGLIAGARRSGAQGRS